MENLKFKKNDNTKFAKNLRLRVEEYFDLNNQSKYGNTSMIAKSIFMLSVFFIPLIILSMGLVGNVLVLFILYIMSGLGMAGVGMGVMHDAIHGSYSKHRLVNKYMGYTMNLIGANADTWRIQHNVLHHTYTNIDHADDDIHTPFFLRFSPNTKRYWIHRFQYLYVWFFYGLSTIMWISVKDFINLRRYHKMGFFKNQSELNKQVAKITIWKMIYYSYALVLPLIMIPLPVWIILLAFFSMHFVTGLCISLVFQTAHVMPSTVFPNPDEKGMIAHDWATHQLLTTTNYAPKSRIFSWLIGGLNYQVEHHLMANISHVHYHKLSKIVAKTAQEHGLPYLVKKTFFSAIWAHIIMLRKLGRA